MNEILASKNRNLKNKPKNYQSSKKPIFKSMLNYYYHVQILFINWLKQRKYQTQRICNLLVEYRSFDLKPVL